MNSHQFRARSVTDGKQGEPGFQEARAVAEVQAAVPCSWDSGHWEDVRPVSEGQG